MSKVTMPEPFGWLSDSLLNGGLVFSKVDPAQGQRFITNSTCAVYRDYQMKQYAAAMVRVALEEAAHICWSMQCSDECERELHDRLLSNAEKRIRALIPK